MYKRIFKRLLKDDFDFLESYVKSHLPDFYYIRNIKKKVKGNQNISSYQLPRKLKNNIKSYWKENLGINVNLYWHRAYIATNGIEDVRYIPENIFYKLIEPTFNRYDLVKPYKDKNLYDLFFKGFKMPTTVLRNINGNFYTKDYEKISIEDALFLVLEHSRINKMIIKPAIESGGGKNVKVIDIPNNLKNNPESEIIKLFGLFGKDFIVQDFIEQHNVMSKMHKNSLNTLRITSLRLDDEIHILSGIVRMGNQGMHVDNATAGGLTCGFNKKGKLNDFATEHIYFKKYKIHPYSEFVFKDVVIPNIEKVFGFVRELHRGLLYFDIASWDIAIDKKGEPVFIEVNLNPQDINFHQRNNGPLFGELTDKVLEEVKKRSKEI